MIGAMRKRNASSVLRESVKRQQVEKPLPSPEVALLQFEDDNDNNEYREDRGDFSGDDQGVETPVTPFSPTRKKFPSELKTLKCTFEGCNKTFNRPIRLETHMKTHTNERSFTCTYEGCNKAYFEDKHLQQHIKGSHTKERNFQCDWEGCSKSFLTSTRLKRHKEAHEGRDRFRCTAYQHCNEVFRKHQTLQRHIRSDHLELAPFPCTYIDPITLDHCNAGFDGAGGLKKHKDRVHSAPGFFCPDCTVPNAFNPDGTPIHAGFTTKAQLQSHIRKEHANCPFCDLKCSSQPQLMKHIDSQHSGTSLNGRKNFHCTYAGCDKSFTKKYNLMVHVRTGHMGERYICGNFDVSSTLDIAAFDTNSGCEKDFVSKASLEDHIRTAHLGLSSLVNAKRIKYPSSLAFDFIDDEEDEGYTPQPKTQKKAKKPKISAIDELIGNGYAEDERRTIPCLFPDCAHKFMRDYDLQNHLRSAHQSLKPVMSDTSLAFAALGNTESALPQIGMEMQHSDGSFENTPTISQGGGNAMYDQADIDWELPTSGFRSRNIPDWCLDNGGQTPDPWRQEEMEMNHLSGDAIESIYPSLDGM